MGLYLDPHEREPLREDANERPSEIFEERRSTRRIELARGAVVCPDCALPLSPAAIAADAFVQCGYCHRLGRAREFFAPGGFDTPANDALLVARL